MTSSGPVLKPGLFAREHCFPIRFMRLVSLLRSRIGLQCALVVYPSESLCKSLKDVCSLYTPDNPPGWRVGAGNVGQHYFRWRYELAPDRGDRNNPIPRGESAMLFGE